MTHNELVNRLAQRAGQLAGQTLDELRAQYPATTDTRAELVRYCKENGWTKAELVQVILYDEFDAEFDFEIGPT